MFFQCMEEEERYAPLWDDDILYPCLFYDDENGEIENGEIENGDDNDISTDNCGFLKITILISLKQALDTLWKYFISVFLQ